MQRSLLIVVLAIMIAGVVYVSANRASFSLTTEPIPETSQPETTPETSPTEAEALRTKPPTDVMPSTPKADASELNLESLLVGEFTSGDVRDSHRLVFTEGGRFEYWKNGEQVEQSTFAVSSDLRTADVGGWDRVEILGPDTVRYRRIDFTRSK